jgi:hypothetical protein
MAISQTEVQSQSAGYFCAFCELLMNDIHGCRCGCGCDCCGCRWPGKAVTFIDNHDTGSTQQHWPFPGDRVGAGYAYIMTHPGMPCVFWDHYFEWGSELRNTIRTLASVSVQHYSERWAMCKLPATFPMHKQRTQSHSHCSRFLIGACK